MFSGLSEVGGVEKITSLVSVEMASPCCLPVICNHLSSKVHTPKTADSQETKESQKVELSESR